MSENSYTSRSFYFLHRRILQSRKRVIHYVRIDNWDFIPYFLSI